MANKKLTLAVTHHAQWIARATGLNHPNVAAHAAEGRQKQFGSSLKRPCMAANSASTRQVLSSMSLATLILAQFTVRANGLPGTHAPRHVNMPLVLACQTRRELKLVTSLSQESPNMVARNAKMKAMLKSCLVDHLLRRTLQNLAQFQQLVVGLISVSAMPNALMDLTMSSRSIASGWS